MRKFILIVMALVSLLVILYVTSPVAPIAWTPAPEQSLSGSYAKNDVLSKAVPIPIDGDGPEDIVFDDAGHLYTGLQDGRVIRLLAPDYQQQETLINTQGRPLGMRFDSRGRLVIADAVKGLIRLDLNTLVITILADKFEGIPLKLVDHLDIATNGDIYFSDASARFGMLDHVLDFVEASFSGRIFRFNPTDATLELLADGLFFANGVALTPDENFLLVNETGTSKVKRVHLHGDLKGNVDDFIAALPGLPDNLYIDDQGIVWISIITLRDWRLEWLCESIWVRKLIAHLPNALLERTTPYGMVVGVNLQSEVIYNLQTDQTFTGITTAVPYDNALYLGFLKGQKLGRFEIQAHRR